MASCQEFIYIIVFNIINIKEQSVIFKNWNIGKLKSYEKEFIMKIIFLGATKSVTGPELCLVEGAGRKFLVGIVVYIKRNNERGIFK